MLHNGIRFAFIIDVQKFDAERIIEEKSEVLQ
jgi:hypothetical protein